MRSNWKTVLAFFALFFTLTEAAKEGSKDNEKKGGLRNMKVSKVGNGASFLDIIISLRYKENFADKEATVSRVRRHVQINDTELAEALDFRKKDRKKVSYVDLKYAVLNGTKISTLFDAFMEDDLEIPMVKDPSFSDRKWMPSKAEFEVDSPVGNKTIMYNPTWVHRKDRDTLTGAVLPTYLLIGIICLICYLGRSRFLPKNRTLFKLSNVSRLISKFLVIRLTYDVIYLSYLIMFVNFKFFNTNGFLYFCFLAADEIINLIAFYFFVAMFIQGYMTLTQDRKPLFALQTIGLTALYAISVTAVEIYYKTKYHSSAVSAVRRVHTAIGSSVNIVDPNSFIAPVIVLSKITIFWASGYFAYVQYSANKNTRFLTSFAVIVISYYGSSLISIPIFASFNDAAEYVRSTFLSVLPNIRLQRVEAPQLIQLAVCCWLVYYWRDLEYDKVSSEQPFEESYELS